MRPLLWKTSTSSNKSGQIRPWLTHINNRRSANCYSKSKKCMVKQIFREVLGGGGGCWTSLGGVRSPCTPTIDPPLEYGDSTMVKWEKSLVKILNLFYPWRPAPKSTVEVHTPATLGYNATQWVNDPKKSCWFRFHKSYTEKTTM
jgi:hypothetical protein